MSFFKNLFGSSKPAAPPPPSINDAIQKQKLAIENIDKRTTLLHHKYSQERENAKQLAAGRKGRENPKLKACLRRMKMHEKQIDKLESQRFNIDQMMSSLENMDSSKVTLDATQAYNEAAQHQMKTMDADQVDDIIADNQDLQDEVEEVSDMLSQPWGAAALEDEDELLAEFYDDMAAEAGEVEDTPQPVLPTVSTIDPLPSVPQPVAQQPVRDADEDEFARLEAEMMM
jgi:hypothetical protein